MKNSLEENATNYWNWRKQIPRPRKLLARGRAEIPYRVKDTQVSSYPSAKYNSATEAPITTYLDLYR